MAFTTAPNMEAPTEGLKRAFYAETDAHSLYFATNATDEEMQGRFLAWCLLEGEWLWINGWMLADVLEDDGVRDDPMAERRALGETARD
jgi:hypothetical protein